MLFCCCSSQVYFTVTVSVLILGMGGPLYRPLQSILVKHGLTKNLKPTTVAGVQKQPLLEKKPPHPSFKLSFLPSALKNVNGRFLLPPLLFFRGGRALWSIALVSHREGITEVSVEPLICVLHCPNGLCLLFSLYLSPSASLWIPSLSRLVLHNHLFYRFLSFFFFFFFF